MRLLWSTNSPWSTSGYGAQAKILTPRLRNLGHDVAIAANHGLEGQQREWDGIPIYPRGFHPQSLDILHDHAKDFQADGLAVLYDAWPYDVTQSPIPVMFYYPVDMEPIPPKVKAAVKKGALRVAMSRFGQRMTEDEDMEAMYAPHGYDARLYHYTEPGLVRQMFPRDDRYVVGIVAANNFQPPRKCWPQLFEGFKLFHDKHPEALLYVHSLTTQEMQGCDLVGMAGYLGIPDDAVLFCNQYQYRQGFPEAYMREAYSLMDTLLLVSLGEGFGVPLVEAQACGTPVVTGEWTAMGELCKSGILVPTDTAFRQHIPDHSFQYLPEPHAIAEALEVQYETSYDRAEVAAGVAEYEINHIVEHQWRPIMTRFSEMCDVHEPQILRVA